MGQVLRHTAGEEGESIEDKGKLLMETVGRIEFNISDCFKLFQQSYTRVRFFSCITDNLNTSILPEEWEIKNSSGANYHLGKVDKEREQYIIDGYKYFMQRYLVRDCVESFALSLDKLFLVLLLHGKRVPTEQKLMDCLSNQEKKVLKKFENAGLSSKEGKVQILKTEFSIELADDYNTIIDGLKDIRNCLSHNNGVVREKDGQKGEKGERKFHWSVFSIFAVGEESGEEFPIKFGEPFKESVNICGWMNVKNNYRTFAIGESITFAAHEAFEIATSLCFIANELMKQVGENLSPVPVKEEVVKD